MGANQDAAALVMELHGQLLRLGCSLLGKHYAGLQVLARENRRRLPARLVRRLGAVDQTFSLLRH
eukprot:4972280-Prorocentrum_lima.AAC.1